IEIAFVKLAKFLEKNKRGDPPAGTAGAESDWLDVGTVEASTGSLWAGDPYACNAEAGCVVKVPPGIYVVQAKAMDFSGRKRISRLRVVLHAAGKPSLGKQVGETCTDTARLAVCDIGALNDAVGDEDERFHELVLQHGYKDCGSIRLQMKKPVEMPYV